MRHGGRWLVVRDSVPRRRGHDVDLRGEGLWLTVVDEGDGRYTVGLEAFALGVDDPREELGERMPLGLDVEWDEGRLQGELLVDDERIELDVPATLDVS